MITLSEVLVSHGEGIGSISLFVGCIAISVSVSVLLLLLAVLKLSSNGCWCVSTKGGRYGMCKIVLVVKLRKLVEAVSLVRC